MHDWIRISDVDGEIVTSGGRGMNQFSHTGNGFNSFHPNGMDMGMDMGMGMGMGMGIVAPMPYQVNYHQHNYAGMANSRL